MLQKLNITDFDKLYPLMDMSFPVDEHRPYTEQKALFSNPVYQVYALPNPKSNSLKAFIALWNFSSFIFIEHFAVHPDFRNQGLGALILQELQGLFSCPLCLEVELPDAELARRRIAFYQRNGFYYNDYPYVQPPLSSGQNTVPLRVMTSGSPLSPEAFQNIKKTLYAQVYHVSPEDFL